MIVCASVRWFAVFWVDSGSMLYYAGNMQKNAVVCDWLQLSAVVCVSMRKIAVVTVYCGSQGLSAVDCGIMQ